MESLPSGHCLPPSSRCLDQDFLLQPRALGSWVLSQAAKASIFKSVPWRSGPRGLPWFLQHWGTGVWADVQRLRPSSQPLSTEGHQPPLEAPGTQPRALPRATACLLFFVPIHVFGQKLKGGGALKSAPPLQPQECQAGAECLEPQSVEQRWGPPAPRPGLTMVFPGWAPGGQACSPTPRPGTVST